MAKSEEGDSVPKVKPERVSIELVGAPEPEPEPEPEPDKQPRRKGGDGDTSTARE